MRILFVQPSINPPGGGNLVACWMLEALRDEHALTLLSWHRPRLEACNRFYGTSLRPADFALQLAPAVPRQLAALSPIPLQLLKDSYLLRRAITEAGRYDLVVTANNEADLGHRGIQYVHFPRLDHDRPAVELRWYHGWAALRKRYYRLCARVGRHSRERMAANVTLVNSAWIGRRLHAVHGIESLVVHPPVPGAFPTVPWEKRDDGFVAIGRLSPEKRFGRIIDIIREVRAAGRDIRLHIVGTPGPAAYTRAVRRRVRDNAAWASLHENLSRHELLELVALQRYGIHAMPDEHFGIAVAEMVRAGCVVFVPNEGGPAEIVGGQPALLFESPGEAVRKILAMLADDGLQATARADLAQRAALFSAARFVTELREIVRRF